MLPLPEKARDTLRWVAVGVFSTAIATSLLLYFALPKTRTVVFVITNLIEIGALGLAWATSSDKGERANILAMMGAAALATLLTVWKLF